MPFPMTPYHLIASTVLLTPWYMQKSYGGWGLKRVWSESSFTCSLICLKPFHWKDIMKSPSCFPLLEGFNSFPLPALHLEMTLQGESGLIHFSRSWCGITSIGWQPEVIQGGKKNSSAQLKFLFMTEVLDKDRKAHHLQHHCGLTHLREHPHQYFLSQNQLNVTYPSLTERSEWQL